MNERRKIEREFGVPIAGEILPPERWTKTGLKHWPEGPLDFETLFGRRAPVVLDLGCGNGRYLIGSAVWRPDHDHLGVDSLPLVIRYATRRANQRGLVNLRFAVGNAKDVVERKLAPGSVREIHCYHPQPYHDPREAHRRLLTPACLARVHAALEGGGSFFCQTDNAGYWQYLMDTLPVFFNWQEQSRTWLDAPKGRTRREIIALKRGLPVFRGYGSKRAELSEAEALDRAASLPTFDAGPRDCDLDALEETV